MTQGELIQLAKDVALRAGVDPATFCALVHHESSWDTWACRYEPAFYERYISSMKGLTDTEMRYRATSFGLGQVMGQVAREQGFTGKWLTELCDPAVGLAQAAKKFKYCAGRFPESTEDALLAYNGGGDKSYPAAVLQYVNLYA